MKNISFILDGYKGIYDKRYIFVVVLSLLYPVMIISNSLLIYVICAERGLHKPMYIFICNLACINLYGGSAVTPFVLTKILTENYQITWLSCLVQIFSLFTYGGCDLTNLTVMAYDRYISICYPLEYEKIVTPAKVAIGVVVSWLLPFVRTTITISITGNLNICGVIIEKVYCDNFSVVKLACSDTLSNNIYGVVMMSLTILPVFIIFYTYVRIIFICLKLSKTSLVKFSTCVPHLIALLNFVIGIFFEIFQSRFNMRHVPYTVRVILSLYVLILSPIINPIMYGEVREEQRDSERNWKSWGLPLNNGGKE
ncbi:olfactory receptor 52L1-like [Carassius carassius]|uniref:olfactory receptor 52L1-like n=1 Tax=Carassius carassius TaxID=217509 RepID=UPI0028694AE9|nr:olfactory receptor 52L1-like [Carassius carassius]